MNRVLLAAPSLIGVTLLACGTASAARVPKPNGDEEGDPAQDAPVVVQMGTASNDVSPSDPRTPALEAVGNEVGLTARDLR